LDDLKRKVKKGWSFDRLISGRLPKEGAALADAVLDIREALYLIAPDNTSRCDVAVLDPRAGGELKRLLASTLAQGGLVVMPHG
jgi:hypothetical protein